MTDFEPTAAEAVAAGTSANLVDVSWSSEDSASEGGDEESAEKLAGPKWGIHALPLDHYPLATYLEKGQNITNFEQEGTCVVCHSHLDHDKGLYAICSNGECTGMGHLACWSRHLLEQSGEHNNDTVLLPTEGHCPKCRGTVRWGDMMKELTLRTRGQKEIDKILKKHGKVTGLTKATKKKAKSTRDMKSPAKNKSPSKAKGKAKAVVASSDPA